MNNKLLEYLGGDEAIYPKEISTQFPGIIEKMISLWEAPEFEKYLDGLLFDTRGNRHGFPPDVTDELWAIHNYRMKRAFEREPVAEKDYWNWIPH